MLKGLNKDASVGKERGEGRKEGEISVNPSISSPVKEVRPINRSTA